MTNKDSERRVSRREFLGVSSAAALGAAVGAGAVGAAGGYLLGSSMAPADESEYQQQLQQCQEEVDDLTQDKNDLEQDVQDLQQQLQEKGKIKAGFVYVGPVGDYGWTYAHDVGRQYAVDQLPWLETATIESVAEPDVGGAIDTLVSEECDIVFTTSFGYMDGTIEAGERHPDKIFEHCSGFKRSENVGTYFSEFYQLYYLCGLAGGAMTQTGKLGYIAAHYIPEVIRHMNAFVIGAREVNPDIEVYSVELKEWFDPVGTREAAESLIDVQDVDVLAYTEDTPTTLVVAQEHQEAGEDVWSFSHYSDMTSYGPQAHLTGQIVNWGLFYVPILSALHAGAWRSKDIWGRVGHQMEYPWIRPPDQRPPIGTPEGSAYPAPLSPEVPAPYRSLIATRYEEMKELLFEPFTGPLRDNDGQLRVEEGQRLNHDQLWEMDWFIEGVLTEML